MRGAATRPRGIRPTPWRFRRPRAPNPLTGAHFFVDGPAHGAAAGAIAQLLGINPAPLPDSESWATFAELAGPLAATRRQIRALASQVTELAKIAAQPEVQRISAYSRGGGSGAVFLQTEKILCQNLTADPGSIPILNTYFLHPAAGNCPSPGALRRAGRRSGAASTSSWTPRSPAPGRVPARDRRDRHLELRQATRLAAALGVADLRYEIGKVARAPPRRRLRRGRLLGLQLVALHSPRPQRDRHQRDPRLLHQRHPPNWTINEVSWATRSRRLTHGAHFIVNTARTATGRCCNPHPRTQGIEDSATRPGRGLGPPADDHTGFPLADAWLWTSPPGNSSGCGGGPRAASSSDARGDSRREGEQPDRAHSSLPQLALLDDRRVGRRRDPAAAEQHRPDDLDVFRPGNLDITRESYATISAGRWVACATTPRSMPAATRARTPTPVPPAALAVTAALGLAAAGPATAHARPAHAARAPQAQAADAQQCPEPYSAQRDPSNPLALAGGTGRQPADRGELLRRRARPRCGRRRDRPTARHRPQDAAGQRVLGAFQQQLAVGPLAGQLPANPGAGPAGRRALEDRRSARGPALQHLLAGRRPGRDLQAGGEDLLPQHDRRSRARSRSSTPTSCTPRSVAARPPRRYAPTAPRSGAGSTRWLPPPTCGPPCTCSSSTRSAPHAASCKMGSMPAWEADLRYEMNKMQALPHTVVYVEGGYSDPTRPATRPRSSTRSASARSAASSPTTPT